MTKDVTLLTGFLGSGKTTLLNALMAARPHTRYALIENEFGEESIDGALVLRPDVDIVEMSNGCLCCSLNDGLLDVLEALEDRQDSFDELIIETTGIADPAGVAMPFLMLPMRSGVPVQRTFTLKRIICLVDAERIEDQLRDTEEAITQISFSDIILINKTDSVPPEYIIELSETLRGLNPFAGVLIGNSAGYPIDELFAIERDSAASVRPTTYLPKRQDPNEKHHPEDNVRQAESVQLHRHHHHVHSQIVSLSFRFAEPFYLTELYHRLMSLVLFRGQDIYRIKGIIAVTNRSERMVLQSVGQSMTITEGADWLPGEDRITRLVFIGKGLKLAEFEALLRQCLTGQSTWEMTTAARLMETPNP